MEIQETIINNNLMDTTTILLDNNFPTKLNNDYDESNFIEEYNDFGIPFETNSNSNSNNLIESYNLEYDNLEKELSISDNSFIQKSYIKNRIS